MSCLYQQYIRTISSLFTVYSSTFWIKILSTFITDLQRLKNKTIYDSTVIIHLSGFVSAMAYGYLAYLSTSSVVDVYLLWGLCFGLGLLSFGLCYLLKTRDAAFNIYAVIVWAVIFRLLGVYGDPILEDDYYRYLFDAYLLFETGSPYGVSPADYFDEAFLSIRFEDIVSAINHPHLSTVYGPVCQLFFALAYLIAPGEIWPLQLLFAMVDMMIIYVLFHFNIQYKMILYAWCPLVIKEFAFTAHTDVLGVFLLLLAYYVLCKKSHLHFAIIPILLALSVASKIFALLVLPFFMGFDWRKWLVFSFSLILIYLPFLPLTLFTDPLLHFNQWLATKESGILAMSSGWLFNAPIYYALSFIEVFKLQTYLLVLLGLACACYFMYLYPNTQKVRLDHVYVLFLLAIPVLNPWYVLWVLPFACLQKAIWPWVASLSVLLAYGHGLNLSQGYNAYEQPMQLVFIEYTAILIAVYYDIYRGVYRLT